MLLKLRSRVSTSGPNLYMKIATTLAADGKGAAGLSSSAGRRGAKARARLNVRGVHVVQRGYKGTRSATGSHVTRGLGLRLSCRGVRRRADLMMTDETMS